MSGHDNRIELTIMGTLGAGVILALAYAFWLSVAGTAVTSDESQITQARQDTQLVAQETPAAVSEAKDSTAEAKDSTAEAKDSTSEAKDSTSEAKGSTQDSAQNETAEPSALGPAVEPAPAETSQTEAASAPEPLFIAGTAPDQRPEAAPSVAPKPHDPSWYKKALTGIAPPYPASMSFLEQQGAWYTPFNHPGMTGPYDIRNWYGR